MTCMQLTRHDGPDLWDLITASLDRWASELCLHSVGKCMSLCVQ